MAEFYGIATDEEDRGIAVLDAPLAALSPLSAVSTCTDLATIPAVPDWQAVTLRISGGKPLHMRARLLAAGSSRAARSTAWHEAAVYLRDGADYVVALNTRRSPAEDGETHRAEAFPTLEEATTWLEAFDPTADLTVDLDASDRGVSTVDIALRAAALRQRTDAVRRQYHAMLGELLFRLDGGAPA